MMTAQQLDIPVRRWVPDWVAVGLVFFIILPVTIRVVKYIKKVDGNDVYDLGTSYNILKVKDI